MFSRLRFRDEDEPDLEDLADGWVSDDPFRSASAICGVDGDDVDWAVSEQAGSNSSSPDVVVEYASTPDAIAVVDDGCT